MPNFPLSKPININGDSVSELSYNMEDMTARDKTEASKVFKKNGNMVMVQEFDSDYHLYLFAAAVKKENPSIEIEDVLRMSAKDSIKAEALVRGFFFFDSEDTSLMSTSPDA